MRGAHRRRAAARRGTRHGPRIVTALAGAGGVARQRRWSSHRRVVVAFVAALVAARVLARVAARVAVVVGLAEAVDVDRRAAAGRLGLDEELEALRRDQDCALGVRLGAGAHADSRGVVTQAAASHAFVEKNE